jgi:hypothetical protein
VYNQAEKVEMKGLALLLFIIYGLGFVPLSLAADEAQSPSTSSEATQPADESKAAADKEPAKKEKKQGEKKEGGASGEEPGCDK